MDFLTISYWNSSDLGGMLYHNQPYKNRMYIDTTPALFEEQVEEEGVEDGDKNFIPTFRKITKIYKCDLVCSPEFIEALYFVQMHDHIMIRQKNDEDQIVKDFAVTKDSDEFGGHLVKCTFQFTTQYVRKTASADNYHSSCFTANLVQVVDVVAWNSAVVFNPSNNGVVDGSRYVVTRPATIGITHGLTQGIYMYSGGQWIEQETANEGDIVYCTTDAINYYFDGTTWRKWIELLTLTNVGTTVKAKGWAMPGTFIQLQLFVAGSYSNVGTPVSVEAFKTTGISYTSSAGTQRYRVHCYSHGCDYGYSNYIVITL